MSANRLARELRVVLVPWVVARVLVGAALALARFVFGEIGSGPRPDSLVQGLFAWDASFYREIAQSGYRSTGGSLRFFPLVPMLTHGLGWVLGGRDAAALVVLVNLSALVFAVLLYRLVQRETGDDALARRSVWLAALAPPAMVLVIGYAEATFMALVVGVFLAIRSRRWGWAVAAGLLAGACRPVGALLVVPIAIEAGRGWQAAWGRQRLARVGAVVAPLAGMAAYLSWVGSRFGDAGLPLRLQQERNLRGRLVNPASALARSAGDLFGGARFGYGLHFLWAILFIVLVVVIARRLPASYTAFAGLTLVSALSASNLDSFERYALSAFPLLVGAAMLIAREEVEVPVMALVGAGLLGYSTLAFLGLYIP
jgi:hypothetical protein